MCKLLVPFFGLYDRDGSETIDRQEFTMILKDLHENIPSDVQGKIFDATDANQNGSLSFEEFLACMVAFALDPNDAIIQKADSDATRRISTYQAYTKKEG